MHRTRFDPDLKREKKDINGQRKKTTQQLKTGAVNPDDIRIFPRRFTTLCPQSGQGMAESRMSNRFLLTSHTEAEAGLRSTDIIMLSSVWCPVPSQTFT